MIEPYYDQDGITIYNADCLEVLPLIAPLDLIITDPPYGVGYDYGDGHDDSPESHWEWFNAALNVMRGAARQVVFTHRQEAVWHLPKPDHLVTWHKPFNLTFSINGWQAKWEPVFVYGGVVTKMQPGAKRPSNTDRSWGVGRRCAPPKTSGAAQSVSRSTRTTATSPLNG